MDKAREKKWPINLIEAIYLEKNYNQLERRSLTFAAPMILILEKAVEKCLNLLREKDRSIIWMCFKEYTSKEEIAAEAKISKVKVDIVIEEILEKIRHRKETCDMNHLYNILKGEDTEVELNLAFLIKLHSLIGPDLLQQVFENSCKVKLVLISDEYKQKNISVNELGLPTRIVSCLVRRDINTVYDLTQMPFEDFIRIRNLGDTSRIQIIEAIKKLGYSLRSK